MNSEDENIEITVPININETRKGTGTLPWIVNGTKHEPRLASWKPLVNGEEAFREVYLAIEKAQKSVDIICWGFQPSMYFIRDGEHPCIGELLVKIARERDIRVRVLGWKYPLNAAGVADEANLPGRWGIKNRAGQTSTDKQFAYDRKWFQYYETDADTVKNRKEAEKELTDYEKLLCLPDLPYRELKEAMHEYLKDKFRKKYGKPEFIGRGFGPAERVKIMRRASSMAADKELSTATIGMMGLAPTHHQKTVLVDYELPEIAVGFVMGHNMLDEYWDTDAHSSKHRTEDDRLPPDRGAGGNLPRQDISCMVTGPVLEQLHDNFAVAWQGATGWIKSSGEDLLTLRNADEKASRLKIHRECGALVFAQLLRTQAQEKSEATGKEYTDDIERLYLQTVRNATQFIYIENQYFRWPPLAEVILKSAAAQTKGGRDPKEHGSLHLFVVTNVIDEGIGKGTLNTQRMLALLGRNDAISGVVKQLKINELTAETFDKAGSIAEKYQSQLDSGGIPDKAVMQEMAAEQGKVIADYKGKVDEIKASKILSEDRPGLKVHICSLVALDSPADNWMPVYIHSKLMIIDDVFTTHGSANINTRSMQVDSEMNIAHARNDVTQALRRRLWKLHTNGIGDQDDAEIAFKKWDDVINQNYSRQYGTVKAPPLAPLIKFDYIKYNITDMD